MSTKTASNTNRTRAIAFELGFAKAASDLGLNDKQYAAMYKIAVHKLSKAQAAPKKK